jgi:hypothetical protein
LICPLHEKLSAKSRYWRGNFGLAAFAHQIGL